MLIETLKTLFTRELNKLKVELELYQDETNIWYIEQSIANSAGNLCLHLVGNLNTYIGAQFGKTGYIRHRDDEFALKDIPRSELIDMVERTIVVVQSSLDMLTEGQLQEEYPAPVFDQGMSTEYFLVHLAMHLSYHLGQVNYHRRLLDS